MLIWAAVISVPATIALVMMRMKKVKNIHWILIPFALVTSIAFLKSAAGCVVDGISVDTSKCSSYQRHRA